MKIITAIIVCFFPLLVSTINAYPGPDQDHPGIPFIQPVDESKETDWINNLHGGTEIWKKNKQIINNLYSIKSFAANGSDKSKNTDFSSILSSSSTQNYRIDNIIELGIAAGNGYGPGPLVINSANNSLYCLNKDSKNVSVIDLSSNEVVKTVPVHSDPTAIALNRKSNTLYVANAGPDYLSKIDCNTGKVVRSIKTGSNPQLIVIEEALNKIFVVNQDSESVTIIDGQTNEVKNTLDNIKNILRTNSIAVDSIHHKIYLASYSAQIDDSKLYVVDMVEEKIEKVIHFKYGLYCLSINHSLNKLYATFPEYNNVIAFDLDNIDLNDSQTIRVGNFPTVLIYLENTNKLAAVNRFSSNISILDCETDEVVKTIDVGDIPDYIKYDKQNRKVFVLNYGSSNLSIIDEDDYSVVESNKFLNLPLFFDYDEIMRQIYVTNGYSGIAVVDYSSGEINHNIVIGHILGGLSLNSETHHMYATSYGGSTIFEIDGLNGSVIRKIEAPGYPALLFEDNEYGMIYNLSLNYKLDPDYKFTYYLNVNVINILSGQIHTIYENRIDNFHTSSEDVGLFDMAIGNNLGYLLISNSQDNKLILLNRRNYQDMLLLSKIRINGTLIDEIEIDYSPTCVISNNTTRRFYISCTKDNCILVFDGLNQEVSKVINVEGSPTLFEINNSKNEIYVSLLNSNNMLVIDGNTDEIINTIDLGDDGNQMKLDDDRQILYVQTDNKYLVLDTENLEIIREINLNSNGFFEYDQISKRLYSTNIFAAKIAIWEDLENPWVTPLPPENISVFESNKTVRLTWNMVENIYSEENILYNVYRSTSVSGPFVSAAENISDTTYQDINLANGLIFYYKLSSYLTSMAIEGEQSDSISGTPHETGDFRISVNPSEIQLIAGNETFSKITIIPLEDFSKNVSFSLANIPTGIEASLDRNEIFPDSIAILRISADNGSSTNSYKLSIKGESGNLSHETEISVEVINPFDGATLVLDQDSLRVGEVLVINGTVGEGVNSVNVEITSSAIDTIIEVVPDANGDFQVEYSPSIIGTYRVVLLDSNIQEKTFEVLKAKTRISLSTNVDNEYIPGYSALVKGKITPAPAGARIHLHIIDPSGAVGDTLMDINEDGFFIREFNFEERGTWLLKAAYSGGPVLAASESGYLKVPVGIKTGKALLLEGYGEIGTDCDKETVENLGSYAYRIINNRRYGRDDIYFVSNRENKDIDADGIEDVDYPASSAGLFNAFEEISNLEDLGAETTLFIYMVGGGYREGEFRLSKDESITFSELDQYIAGVEGKTNCEEVICIIDKPNLANLLVSLGEDRRTIIGSNREGNGYYINNGLLSFSRFMLYNIYDNRDLYIGFLQSRDGIGFESPHLMRYLEMRGNEPVLDATGDGVFSDSDDGILVSEKYIGTLVGLGDFAPVVEWTGHESTVAGLVTFLASSDKDKIAWERRKVKSQYSAGLSSSNGNLEIKAKIQDPEGAMSEAFSVLVSPEGEVVQTIAMNETGNNMYGGQISGESLTRPGRYTIAVFGVDEPDNVSVLDPNRLIYLEKNDILSVGSLSLTPGKEGWLEIKLANSVSVSVLNFMLSAGSDIEFNSGELVGDAVEGDLSIEPLIFGGADIKLDLGAKSITANWRGDVIIRVKVALKTDASDNDTLIIEPTRLEMFDNEGMPVLVLGVDGYISTTDENGGTIGESMSCDFNSDGIVAITDVISLLLYQRAHPDDLKADFNGD